MKNKYDIILLTNQPAFYKIKQWNSISKTKAVLAIFTSTIEKDRNADFVSEKPIFDYHILLSSSTIGKIREFWYIIKHIQFDEIVIGGWETSVEFIAPFLISRSKNSVLVESSVYEYRKNFVKDLVKKAYMKRVCTAYASGKAQKALLDIYGFRGVIKYTGGCGILNYVKQPPFEKREMVSRFLYVGRLVEVKNLRLLIEVFNELPQLILEIIGFGELEVELKEIANNNIHFLGSIANKDLPQYYKNTDVFILPSRLEPWGLVIEEALNNGTPVIVSNKVGCRDDLVTKNTGLVFDIDSRADLKATILKITDLELYNNLRFGVSKLDFFSRAQHQIDIYC